MNGHTAPTTLFMAILPFIIFPFAVSPLYYFERRSPSIRMLVDVKLVVDQKLVAASRYKVRILPLAVVAAVAVAFADVVQSVLVWILDDA